MDLRIGTVLIALGAVGACAPSGADTAPPPPQAAAPVRVSGPRGGIGSTEIHNDPSIVTRSVAAPVDSVRAALPTVFQALGIPQAGADPEQRVFGNPEFRPRRIDGERLSRYIDCGMGITAVPKADDYDVTMSVLTRLTPATNGGTVVATTVGATGKPRGVSGNSVHCPSKGTLEARIVEVLHRELSR